MRTDELTPRVAEAAAAVRRLHDAVDAYRAELPAFTQRYGSLPPPRQAETARAAIKLLEPPLNDLRRARDRLFELKDYLLEQLDRTGIAENRITDIEATIASIYAILELAGTAIAQTKGTLRFWIWQLQVATRSARRLAPQPEQPLAPVLAFDRQWWCAVHGSRGPPDRPRPDDPDAAKGPAA